VIASRPDRRLAVGLIGAALIGLVAGCRTPGARPIGPAIDSQVRFSTRVPDVADYAAAELASAALISDRERAERVLRRLRSIDTVLVTAGELPTGLVPVATDLVNAILDAPRVYRSVTNVLLESDQLDPALRERLSQSEEDDPLALADARIHDAWVISFGRAFNALAEPIGKSVLTTSLAPFRLAKSLISYALQIYTDEPLPLQRRQALGHWKEFVARYPNAPETDELLPRIERADIALAETRYQQMMTIAKRALEVGQPRLALVYADRALRLLPEDREAEAVRAAADRRLLEQRADRHRSIEGALELARPTPAEMRLSVALLDPRGDIASAARELLRADPNGPLADEARFAEALALEEAGLERQSWVALEKLAERDPSESNMARHAHALVQSPGSNPYQAFSNARSLDRKSRTRWLFLGPWAGGLPDRGLPQPVELIAGLPSIAQTIATWPIRLVQLPWMDTQPAARLAAVYGRRYLEQHPDGEYGSDVRSWLSSYERKRGNSIALYHIALQNPDSDSEELAKLREQAAEQAKQFASREERRDLRNAMYRRVAQEYPDTDAGQQAGEAASAELLDATPQQIRISRGFLLENLNFAGPYGLGLDSHLLDGDAANGELHPSGILLIGGRSLELHFVAPSGDEDDPPIKVFQTVSEERFSLMIAQLEETSFRNALIDTDNTLGADANRDVLFERARVGLTDEIDTRPLAQSTYAYRGMRERYGMVRARESILPFDLVFQGSLSDLSLGAFPRIHAPDETPDAFLYR
jgi:hypothetical protein